MLPAPDLMQAVNDPILIGDWLVDPRDDTVTHNSARVKLEPRTMRLLIRLAQTPGEVVSQDELLESVWTGVVVGTASVYQSMSQLRKVLGDTDDPPCYIETVARKGYRLVAKVSTPPGAAPGAAQAPAPATLPATTGPVTDRPAPRWIHLRRVAFAVALTLLAGLSWWKYGREPVSTKPPSIVVLPFADFTVGKTEQAFCDGLTEETSNWLAQLPTLNVIARTSAFAYRDRGADVKAIGRELQTTHVLEGSLRRSGDKVRITVQLIDTQTGFRVWSESYDKEADDVIGVQEDIARKVADNLELRITADTNSRFAGRRSSSAEAQRLFLLAKSHAARQDGESTARAIELYREALKADPTFALAKVWLAHAIMSQRYFNEQPIEGLAPQIEPLLADVEKTSPELVDLYVVRGQFYTEMRKREPAMQDLQHALKLNPNSAYAASRLGFYFLTLGQPRDALTYFTVASSLDPRAYSNYGYRCIAFSDLAAYDMAETACERARALNPESSWVYSVSGQLAEARGNIEQAVEWSDAALKHGSSIAAMQSERARWLVRLGLPTDAGSVYRRAAAENPEGVRHSAGLTFAGAMAAIAAEGPAGFRHFVDKNDLAATDDPHVLLTLADAALMAGDTSRAKDWVARALASPSLATVGSPGTELEFAL